MSKRYNIRWNESDLRELTKAVKNFNAKITRLEKNPAYKDVILPERASVKQLKELVTTRRDLQREIKSLKRFTKRGAEKIVRVPITQNELYITNWQKTEMNRRAGITNRQRNARLKKLEEMSLKSGGEDLGYTRGEFGMGKAEKLSLTPTNAFTPKMDKYDLQMKARSLQIHSQSDYFHKTDQRLLNNYKQALIDTYGEDAVKDILDEIDEMDFNEFYKIFKSEVSTFEFASKVPPDADLDGYLELIRSTWIPKKKEG